MNRTQTLAELVLLVGILLLSVHLLSDGRARSRGAFRTESFNEFLRGDSNDDSEIDISDPVFVLRYLFLGGAEIPCMASADVDDDGAVEVDDVVGVLAYLFLRGPDFAEPFPERGVDPTPDLGCREPPLPEQGPVGSLGGPDRELDADESLSWRRGLELFQQPVGLARGLGPRFNGDSCRGCHHQAVIGGSGAVDLDVVRFAGVDAEGTVVPLEGGPATSRLSIPGFSREECAEDTAIIETRQTPTLLGLGLVDRIPDEVLLANEDPDDLDGDGISGRALRIGLTIGRFGHKASIPSVRDFTADALINEMGVTSDPLNSPFAGTVDDDGVDEPEFSNGDFEDLSFFVSHLAPPPPRVPDDPLDEERIADGELIFDEIGCGACHIPQLVGDEGPVRAYSDFLLHDVADPSRRQVEEPGIEPSEFRTAPLWGLRLSPPYLHDGSAETPLQAIDRGHFGEADAARAAAAGLTLDERQKLQEFLLSL